MHLNPLLDLDYYKITHSSQYSKDITRIVSYFTPRMSRIPGWDKVVMFGLQGLCCNKPRHNLAIAVAMT